MIDVKCILHPTDFGESSKQSLEYACSLATQFSASLHLVHVVQDIALIASPFAGGFPPDYYIKQTQYATDELAKLPGKTAEFKGSVIRKVLEGTPFVEIIKYAKENAVDMIVMGTHGYKGLEHLIIGSVAENVVRKAPCPVLTIHPKGQSFIMP